MEVVSDWNEPDATSEFALIRRVVEKSGRSAVFSLTQRHEAERSTVWRDLMAMADDAIAAGHSIRPVEPPRPIGLLLGLEGSQNPFSGTPSYKEIASKPLVQRVAIMQDPAFRAKVLSEDPIAGSTFPLIRRLMYTQMFRFGNPPNYMPKQDDSIAAMAARQGRTAPDVAYDILIEDGGRNFIYAPLVNYFDFNLSASEAMLDNPNTIMGLGDGGAHVGFILDAGYPTWLMTYWGRERARWSLPEVVRRLTSDTARAAGLGDRGVIAVGKKADLNIIDYDKVGFDRPYVTFDLPSGGRRLLQKAHGYDATIVSGQITYRSGEATGALPGRVVRGQRAA
jgi:N-acyl-D-aspartate/D-glutamate deacylase